MNSKQDKKGYSVAFMKRSNIIANSTLSAQSDSFNAMDTKAQTYISILSFFIAIILGMLALNFSSLTSTENLCAKILTIVISISFLRNISTFFQSIKTQDFKTGLNIDGLHEMYKNTTKEIDEEIFNNLYWSVIDNNKIHEQKSKKLKKAESHLTTNFFLSFFYIIFIIYII